MKKILLSRLESGKQGTFGIIIFDRFGCFSLELADRNNKPNVSCIPVGTYLCKWTYSPRFKREMYEVVGVPNRAGIRIHSANLAKQLNGCISLGYKLGSIDDTKAVLVSKPAVREFEKLLDKKDFELEIR